MKDTQGDRGFPTLSGMATNVPMGAARPQIGAMLGPYELQDPLGRGGMGEVWKAYNATEQRHVVIKLLPPELSAIPTEVARVANVFQQIHALQHEHICPVYQLGQDEKYGYYLVMKFLPGMTLSHYRHKHVEKHKSFPLEQVLKVLKPVARGLDYAHGQKVIHRDIKPENIMVDADGGNVQIVDFGLATEIRTMMTRVSQVRMDTSGTYPYMAPEQWRGRMQDARTDQYALAVVAYELLSGRLPFEAPDEFVLRQCVLSEPAEPIAGVPPHVNAALMKALAKERDERFENCQAFLDALATPAAAPKPAAPKKPAKDDVPLSSKLKQEDNERYKEANERLKKENERLKKERQEKPAPPPQVSKRPAPKMEPPQFTPPKGPPVAPKPQPAPAAQQPPKKANAGDVLGCLVVVGIIAAVGWAIWKYNEHRKGYEEGHAAGYDNGVIDAESNSEYGAQGVSTISARSEWSTDRNDGYRDGYEAGYEEGWNSIRAGEPAIPIPYGVEEPSNGGGYGGGYGYGGVDQTDPSGGEIDVDPLVQILEEDLAKVMFEQGWQHGYDDGYAQGYYDTSYQMDYQQFGSAPANESDKSYAEGYLSAYPEGYAAGWAAGGPVEMTSDPGYEVPMFEPAIAPPY